MSDPETGLWKGPNFKEAPQFLKSNRISFAYGPTSNKDQTFMSKNCFVLLLYRGMRRFCTIFGHFGGMAALGPYNPPLKVMDPRPWLICMCVLACFGCLLIFKKKNGPHIQKIQAFFAIREAFLRTKKILR